MSYNLSMSAGGVTDEVGSASLRTRVSLGRGIPTRASHSDCGRESDSGGQPSGNLGTSSLLMVVSLPLVFGRPEYAMTGAEVHMTQSSQDPSWLAQ